MGVMDGKSFLKVGKEIGWVGNVLWMERMLGYSVGRVDGKLLRVY